MDILEKLDVVQIQPDSRISETDRRFCEAHQQAYEEAKFALCELECMWIDITSRQRDTMAIADENWNKAQSYTYIHGFSSESIRECMELINDKFISNLVRYFNDTYKVSLDSGVIVGKLLPQKPKSDPCNLDMTTAEYHQKLRTMIVNYKDVLDQIFIQLDGRTFLERAVDEIKEECHHAAWNRYYGKANFELKNDTIRFTYGCHFDSWLGHDQWEVNEGMKKILHGLSYFETEVIGDCPSVISSLCGWDKKKYSFVEFTDYTKLLSFKMFKNGRVDIKFKSKDYAAQFVSEFLGTVC